MKLCGQIAKRLMHHNQAPDTSRVVKTTELIRDSQNFFNRLFTFYLIVSFHTFFKLLKYYFATLQKIQVARQKWILCQVAGLVRTTQFSLIVLWSKRTTKYSRGADEAERVRDKLTSPPFDNVLTTLNSQVLGVEIGALQVPSLVVFCLRRKHFQTNNEVH